MGAIFGNLDHTAELETPSVRVGRFTVKHLVDLEGHNKNRCLSVATVNRPML